MGRNIRVSYKNEEEFENADALKHVEEAFVEKFGKPVHGLPEDGKRLVISWTIDKEANIKNAVT